MKTKDKTLKRTSPIKEKEEVQKSNDRQIDQDFEGYPHNPASENIINPKSEEDNITAGVKDGENIAQNSKEIGKNDISEGDEEIDSDGSANAFERTEGIRGNQGHDKPKIDERSKVY